MASGTPREVRLNRRPLPLAPGETVAQALSRSEVPVLQRSIRYHRPRAPFCGIGYCTGCLVRVDGAPNVRSCRLRPSDGAEIRTENAWPSTRWDLLGALDRLFPGGIDTLHGFRWPRFATPVYQRVVRRLAGYGRLPDAPGPDNPPGERLRTPILIVGGGRAGTAAAHELVRRGITPTVVERNPVDVPSDAGRWLVGTDLAFLPGRDPTAPFTALGVRGGQQGVSISAERVLVTTGSYDGPLLFAGSDRPGVMTADGARSLAGRMGVPPFRHAIVVGGEPRVATLLERWGEQIEAVVAPGVVHGQVAETAAHVGVPVHPRTLLLEAEGTRGVRSVRLARRGGDREFSIEADAIVLAHRRLPNPQLFFQAGARMRWRSGGGAYYPELSGCATSVPGLWAAGSAAGFVGPDSAAQTGVAAAIQMSSTTTELGALPDRVGDESPGELEGYYRELLARPPPRSKRIICACEDVLLGEIETASRRGFRGVEVVKRYTSAGTGLCQGRYCLPDVLLLLSIWEGRPPAEVGYITQRPPVTPTSLGALAAVPPESP